MNSLEITVTMIVEVIFIDLALRFSKEGTKSTHKSAGIISLIILSLIQKQKTCSSKALIMQRLFLSILIIIFFMIAQYFLLSTKILGTGNIILFALTLIPLFIAPFYHFIFEIIDASSLEINHILSNFRLRGATALVFSANIVFIYLNALQHIFALAGHLAFALTALLTSFSLSAKLRTNPSVYQAPFKTPCKYLDTEILRYLASILEIFYSIILIYFVFLQEPLGAWLLQGPSFLILLGVFNVLLLTTTCLVKFIFTQGLPMGSDFYESRVLPLSFLLFGLTTVTRNYF